MNCCAQAAIPAVAAGSQGTIFDHLAATAELASASAACRYCSASTGDTLSAVALLSNPRRFSSGGKPLATPLVSPSRSRTVLVYSRRVRRRTYDGPGEGVVPWHSGDGLP